MFLRSVCALGISLALLSVVALAAEGRAEKPKLPEGMQGFSGMLRGTVVEVADNGRGFHLKVDKIVKLWKGNEAEQPEQVVGKTVLINARWTKGENGRWHPVERHVKFINSLEVDETIDIEAINNEGQRLHILELSEEQRERGK